MTQFLSGLASDGPGDTEPDILIFKLTHYRETAAGESFLRHYTESKKMRKRGHSLGAALALLAITTVIGPWTH